MRANKLREREKNNAKIEIQHHEYFQGHSCTLPKNKLTEYDIKCKPWRKFHLDLTAVKKADVRARYMYKSFASLCAEKYHHFKHYPFSIHPFSKLRFGLELITFISILITNALVAVYYSRNDPRSEVLHVYILTFLDIIYLFHILANFLTGYVEGHTSQYVVLDLNLILFRYLRTWAIIDIASTIGIIFNNNHSRVIVDMSLLSLKIFRTPRLFIYAHNIMQVMKAGMATQTIIEMTLYLVTYLEWNIFYQFAVEYSVEDSFTPINPRVCSWLYIAKLWNETLTLRFVYALDRAVGMLRENSNLNLIDQAGCFEKFFVISWIVAKLVVIHCGLKYIIALFGSESARAKYFMMAQQVKSYMSQRKFPPRMKTKILKFYALRFQSNFFVESRMISCVSGQLREDIIMHTGRELVSHVAFLKQLPRALLLQIGIKLNIVIFIAGDIIFKINTIGDCLYFIDKGTVAIYSESGKEICHLEDGDFFGEIALVMKSRFRTTSAVAVTNVELFRLDRADFESTIACYPTVYEDIKKVATSRYESTSVMDDHHKTEMKNWRDETVKRDY